MPTNVVLFPTQRAVRAMSDAERIAALEAELAQALASREVMRISYNRLLLQHATGRRP